ncbi:MAG: DUF2461 domain-containing protein [Aureliella sp.]
MASKFKGFPAETFDFLSDLGENNDREWFAKNRDRYESSFLTPALDFIEAIKKPLDRAAPCLVAEPKKSGGSLLRIYKDTRFSKDKTPYKTNLGIQFRHMAGKDIHAPGIYVHIACDECFLGAGMWRPPGDVVKAVRAYIEASDSDWKKMRRGKKFREAFEMYDDRLKTAPRGVAKDHPLIDELRLKSYIGMAKLSRRELQSEGVVDQTIKLIRAARPLMIALCAATNQPY